MWGFSYPTHLSKHVLKPITIYLLFQLQSMAWEYRCSRHIPCLDGFSSVRSQVSNVRNLHRDVWRYYFHISTILNHSRSVHDRFWFGVLYHASSSLGKRGFMLFDAKGRLSWYKTVFCVYIIRQSLFAFLRCIPSEHQGLVFSRRLWWLLGSSSMTLVSAATKIARAIRLYSRIYCSFCSSLSWQSCLWTYW